MNLPTWCGYPMQILRVWTDDFILEVNGSHKRRIPSSLREGGWRWNVLKLYFLAWHFSCLITNCQGKAWCWKCFFSTNYGSSKNWETTKCTILYIWQPFISMGARTLCEPPPATLYPVKKGPVSHLFCFPFCFQEWSSRRARNRALYIIQLNSTLYTAKRYLNFRWNKSQIVWKYLSKYSLNVSYIILKIRSL